MKGKGLLMGVLLLVTIISATGCSNEQEEQTEPDVITSPSGVPASTDGE